MVEMDSISSNPSLLPWGGGEAGKSWVLWTESRKGGPGGKPPKKREYLLAALGARWDGGGKRRLKERSEKQEDSREP